jgi:ABC-type sugar transport system substrate-binding protein
MKLTLLAVACVGLLLSFVGLEPLASYKDKTIAFISPSIQSFWQQLFH